MFCTIDKSGDLHFWFDPDIDKPVAHLIFTTRINEKSNGI